MKPVANILVVDDEPSIQQYLVTLLQLENFSVEVAGTGSQALERLQKDPPPDVVLLDLIMPDMDGLEVLERLRTIRPSQPVIMLSCVNDTRKVAQAMRYGAVDYLSKPFHKADLEDAIAVCLKGRVNLPPAPARTLETDLLDLGGGVHFYAGSDVMRRIRAQAQLVAKVDLPILMLGESGTGKEVVAHLIHRFSPRASRTFIKVNCAAVPSELLESELFGYEAGAFTGANKPKPGKFEMYNRGTILLDEIGEMPPALQAKLLHVLQDGTFSRLGGRSTMKVDVRVLAATNINMRVAIAERKFREDLYYRLNGFTLTLPPLRDRKEEVPMLLKYFMNLVADKYGRDPLPMSAALIEACMKHSWPGNLRELENFVKRYLVLREEQLMIEELRCLSPHPTTMSASADVPAGTGGKRSSDGSGLKGLVRSLKGEAESDVIAETLNRVDWNRKKAAAELKISYKALLYKIRQYDIHQNS